MYDEQEDPGEYTNLAQSSKHAKIAAELKARMHELIKARQAAAN